MPPMCCARNWKLKSMTNLDVLYTQPDIFQGLSFCPHVYIYVQLRRLHG